MSGTVDRQDWQGCLGEFGWLDDLSPAELQRIQPEGQCRDVARGSVIFQPRSQPEAVYLLREGLVRIFRQSPEGEEITLGYVGPHEIFGELAGLCDFPRESYAIAVTRCRVCTMSQDSFAALLAQHMGIVQDVLRMIARRFKRIESRLTHIVLNDAYGRLCAILHELASDFARPDPAGVRIDIPLTQSDLAALVGAARQTVNRLLRKLEDTGVIARRRRHIIVLDPATLEQLAETAA